MKKKVKKTKLTVCSNCMHKINQHSKYGCMVKQNNQFGYCPCGEKGTLYEK